MIISLLRPSNFTVYFWDDRPGSAKAAKGWFILTGEQAPSRIYVPVEWFSAYRNTGGACSGCNDNQFAFQGRRPA